MNAASATIATPFTRARAKKKRDAPTAGHASLFGAFSAAQHDARRVQKDGRNEERGFAYATAEAIIIEAKAIMAEHGLSVMPMGTKLRRSDIVAVGGVELVASYLLVHASSGETLDLGERVWPVIAQHDQSISDAHASADTSLLAYFLRDLLQMPRVEEGRDLPAARTERVDTVAPFARASGGSGARRAGGSPRAAAENIVKLTKTVDAEMERLGVADEHRDAHAVKVLGRVPSTATDLRELIRKMRGRRA